MIYFVDEDEVQLEPFKMELEIRGYEVGNIMDADEAYSILTKCQDDLQLAIIDVMLSADTDPNKSRFNRARTKDYLETGLRLVEDLIETRNDLFPEKALLFSMASDPNLLKSIESVSSKHNIPFYDKNKYTSALKFGDDIDKHIKVRERKQL